MMRKVNLSHKILSSVLALLMVFTSFPIINTYAAVDENLGQVSAITKPAEINDTDQSQIVVTYDEITLEWSPADKTIGRTKDGWWAGIKMTAPVLDASVLENATYESFAYGANEPVKNKSFWKNQDSKETDEQHYITLWTFVNEENLNKASSTEEGVISTSWSFDWNNDGVNEQTVTTQISPKSVVLNKGGKQVYPVQPGTVTAITNEKNAVIDDKDSANIVVSYKDKLELEWSPADKTVGRTKDGWWTGIKMTAPDLDASVLKNTTYDSLANGTTEWVENKSFWNNQDSKETDEQHYITLWTFVNEEDLNDALTLNSSIETSWRFDWNNDGIMDQTVTTQINPSEVEVILNKDNKQVYPATELGTVTEITGTPNIENDKTNSVSVSFNKEVTLQWSQADAKIGRTKDGWWAGIKMTAPQGADLENAKYKSKATPTSNWVVGKEFAKAKDGDDFITLWAYVANEDMLKNGIHTQWGFDWDNDGVYEQYVDFKFDSANVNLDYKNLYAMDKAAPIISGLVDSTTYTKDDVIVDFNVVDGATENNGVSYTSGICDVYFSAEKLADKTVENISKLEKANKIDDIRYSFTVNNDTNKRYYIYAIDNSNNVTEDSVLVQVDKTAPVFEKNPVVDTEEWTSKDVTITGRISDNLSGIADESNFTITTEAKDVIFNYNSFDEKSGEYTITIPAQTFVGNIVIDCVDNAGNKGTQKFSLQMDKTNCVVMSLEVSESNWTNSDVVITGTVVDLHSGVKEVTAVLDSEYEKEPIVKYKSINENSGEYTITVPAQNYNGKLTVNAIDNAGNDKADKDNNVACLSVDLKMDTTAPEVKKASVSKTGWTNSDVVISGEVSDNLSNVSAVYYAKGNAIEDLTISNISAKATLAEFDKAANTYSFDVSKQNYDGNYVIYAVDTAGNISMPETVTVHMDIEAPSPVEITYSDKHNVIETIKGAIFWFFNPDKDMPCEVTLTSTDNLSGIRCFEYSLDGGETFIPVDKESVDFVPSEKSATYTFTIAPQFRGKVTAKSTDNSGTGNTSVLKTDEKTIVVDNTSPEISVKYISEGGKFNLVNAENQSVNSLAEAEKVYYNKSVLAEITVGEENFFEGQAESVKDEDGSIIETKTVHEVGILVEKTTVNGEKSYIEYLPKTAEGAKSAEKKYIEADSVEYFEWDSNETLHTAKIDFADDADYKLIVEYTDFSENNANVTDDNGNKVEKYESKQITIDKTAPVIEITYSDLDEKADNRVGKGYFLNRTATVTVTEHNFDKDAFKASITAEDITKNAVDTEAQKALTENKWTDSGDVHTLVIPYIDDAVYAFVLNELKDLAKNDYTVKAGNDSIFKKGTETPDSFTVDETAPSDVVITYSNDLYKENKTALETILNNLFWFYNPDKGEKCTVTLTTTDMTSGIQYFTYSYDNNTDFIDVQTKNTENVKVDKQTGWEQDKNDPSVFTYSFDIPAQFRGKVKATATDNAGNVTGNETISDKAIVVDTDIPGLEVDYPDAVNKVNDVNYYSDNVTVTFIVNEENFMDGEFKGNVNDFVANVIIRNDKNNYIYGTDDQGQPMPKRYPIDNWERDKETNKWIGSITLEEEGDYTLDISYADKSKNAVSYTNANYQFTIDKTVPKVKVDFDSIKPIHTIDEREYYNTNRSAVITVTEHNFFPEYFETKNILKAQNILGDEVTNYIKYFKDSKNWTTDSTGNVHTIKVDFKSDANYSFDFEFEDLAKNKCADYKEYRFTVDKTAPKNLKVSYSANVYETVINAITFGYYDSKMTVTISADDDTTGIYHFMYSYLTANGVSNVNAQLVNDAINRAKITRNGKTSTATFTIPKSSLERNSQFNGTVEFTAYDYAENNTYRDDTKRVVVDNISPTSTITFNEPVQNANNVSYYAGNIDATISINEANFYSQDVEVIVTKDGSRYPVSVNWTDNSVDSHTGTFRLTEDGDYVVKVVYSDRSGNAMAAYESNQLTIDTVDPVITVTGLNHQSANNGKTIGFSISVTDKNIALSEFKPVLTAVIRNDNGELETITIGLGDPVTSTNDRGETVYTYTVQNLSVDGFYSLTCSAVDYANHSVNLINSGQDNGTSSNEETMNFSVNREGSTFWIETTHNDKYSSKTFTNELDKAYANDSVEIVVHELNVDQVNISNDSDEETVFALHDGTSTGYVTLQEGSGSNGNYVKNTLRGEGGWYETRYTLSNDNFAHDGVYSFSILSYDRAGNSNLNTKDDTGVIKFTVDRTNPVITSNISTNQVIDADSHTVEFEINDTNHDKNTVEVTLNGKPVPNESITSLGGNSYSFEMSTGSKQSVSVTSKDLAGNTADQYEINDVTVSTNQFVLFYYSHTLLFWIIVAGIVLLALLILFIVFRRKKDDDEDEEKA